MGCSSIVDPRSAPTTTYVPAATDSIYTTTPNVVLRPGDPLTVSVNVESLPNAPLDLYILMDLSDSMAAPLATVKSISQLIAQQVSSITTNVRIGFGAFNDKPIYPYSPQTPAGCLPGRDAPDCSDRRAGTRQYSFLHLVNFTSNFSDYPSVGLVASLLKKYDVIPIFGIVPITSSTLLINNTFLSSYQALQDLILVLELRPLHDQSSSASDVLDVIKTVYQEVIQNIAITLPTQSDVEVSLTQITCPKSGLESKCGITGQKAEEWLKKIEMNIKSHDLQIFCCRIGILEALLPWTSVVSPLNPSTLEARAMVGAVLRRRRAENTRPMKESA
eukprot:Em0605g3a